MIQRVEAGRDITAASLADLGRALPQLVSQGVTAVSIDVSKVVEFDSGSLEALVEFDALARNRGLLLELSGVPEVLGLALQITGLADRLCVRSDVTASTATIPPAPAPAPGAMPSDGVGESEPSP